MPKQVERINIKGHPYKIGVALVNTYYEDGVPRNVTLLKDTSVVNLAGGEHFITYYTPIENTEPNPERMGPRGGS